MNSLWIETLAYELAGASEMAAPWVLGKPLKSLGELEIASLTLAL